MREFGTQVGTVLAGAYPMLKCCITGKCFFYYVVMSVTGSFIFALYLFEEVFTICYFWNNVQDMCKIKIDWITLKQVEKLKY